MQLLLNNCGLSTEEFDCWLVSSISVKGVRGLGKRLSNPCNWHHPSPLHSFSNMWPKMRKLVFVWCPSWLSNATQSLLLRWEALRGQNAAFFFLKQTEHRRQWGQHCRLFRFPELKACKTTPLEVTLQKHFLWQFWESCLQNITSLCESTPRLATWMPGQLRNFTYHTAYKHQLPHC